MAIHTGQFKDKLPQDYNKAAVLWVGQDAGSGFLDYFIFDIDIVVLSCQWRPQTPNAVKPPAIPAAPYTGNFNC